MANNKDEKVKKEKQPETLNINIIEDVNVVEVPPGIPGQSKEELKEALPKEEIEKRQKIMLEYTRLSGRYCKPHTKKSRWVEEKDLDRLMADGKDLVAMCNIPRGKYSGITALAHSQIEENEPLRFFILSNGVAIINPIITEHTKAHLFKAEACMSYFDREIKTMIPRYNKITVTYQTLKKGEKGDIVLSKPLTDHLSGSQAHVFQHKIGHLNGKGSDIYADDYTPKSCIWLGEGQIDIEEFSKLYKVNDGIEEAEVKIKTK